MATKQNKDEKLTAEIKGRCAQTLKTRLLKHAVQIERSEGFIVRKSVEEFLDRNLTPAK